MSQLPQVWPLFPPESLFPSDERGIWPDALDIQISTATDADVRSLKQMVSEHVQATCIGPRAHSSIQEMMHKTRLNPAPLLHRKKYTKAKPICSWTHSSKIQIFCCVLSIWKCKFEGKRWKWMCNLQIRRGSIGIFRRQIQDIIYSPPLWQQPALLYCENLWLFLLQCFTCPSRVCNTHIWRLRNPPAQTALGWLRISYSSGRNNDSVFIFSTYF